MQHPNETAMNGIWSVYFNLIYKVIGLLQAQTERAVVPKLYPADFQP
jgi:hypothetical protein